MSQNKSWLPYILVPQCLELTMILKEPYWRKYCQLELRDGHHLSYKKGPGRNKAGKTVQCSKNEISSNALSQHGQGGGW